MSTEKYPDSEYYGGTRAIPAVEVTSPHPAPVSSPTPVQGQIIYISNGPATANPIVGPGYRPNERFDAENVARPVRPINRWADNICDWPKNLYPSCYCACCVCWGLYIQAQMAHKVQLMNFWSVVYIAVTFWVITFILQLIFPSSGIMAWLMAIFSLIFSIILRLRIVARDNINTPGGALSECFAKRSLYVVARHLYGYSKVLDGDGDPFRPDGYAHQV
eukprot:gene3403-3731_t